MPTKVQPLWSAQLYAQARPDYPESIIDAIFATATLSTNLSPLNIVDLGAGTGICTKKLIEACCTKKYPLASITSLDAASNMLEELSKSLFDQGALIPTLKKQGQLDGNVKTATGVCKFEDYDMTKFGLQGKVDLITIAQAWHWCSDWEKGLDNLADSLKEGGVTAILWNMEDREAAKWVGQVRDLYEEYENNTPQYRHKYWHAMYKTKAIERFEVLPTQTATRLLPTTVEGVCSRAASKSYISVLPQPTQDQIMQSIRSLFETQTDEELQRQWIDKDEGVFAYPYTTREFQSCGPRCCENKNKTDRTDLPYF